MTPHDSKKSTANRSLTNLKKWKKQENAHQELLKTGLSRYFYHWHRFSCITCGQHVHMQSYTSMRQYLNTLQRSIITTQFFWDRCHSRLSDTLSSITRSCSTHSCIQILQAKALHCAVFDEFLANNGCNVLFRQRWYTTSEFTNSKSKWCCNPISVHVGILDAQPNTLYVQVENAAFLHNPILALFLWI